MPKGDLLAAEDACLSAPTQMHQDIHLGINMFSLLPQIPSQWTCNSPGCLSPDLVTSDPISFSYISRSTALFCSKAIDFTASSNRKTANALKAPGFHQIAPGPLIPHLFLIASLTVFPEHRIRNVARLMSWRAQHPARSRVFSAGQPLVSIFAHRQSMASVQEENVGLDWTSSAWRRGDFVLLSHHCAIESAVPSPSTTLRARLPSETPQGSIAGVCGGRVRRALSRNVDDDHCRSDAVWDLEDASAADALAC
ncbi:hypothetical protein GGX14DRAFT_554423 [Mycena pura]|uniref:Uncharacterized protein n=1 Tax=Mycena pura TaxID=153505 RepID=A0AAD6YSQ3_9AGAR|nr:hypothetical protein GGX14DRAFT_554423 [Mycena pura]